LRPFVAGIIGAGPLVNGVDDLGVVDPAQVHRGVDWLSDSPNASTAVAIDVDDELGRRLSRVSELV
jgi:hypothetical protein